MDNGDEDPWDKPTPLNSLYPLNDQMQASNWVLLKAKEIQLCVGLPCIGYEDQFMALLASIEAGLQLKFSHGV